MLRSGTAALVSCGLLVAACGDDAGSTAGGNGGRSHEGGASPAGGAAAAGAPAGGGSEGGGGQSASCGDGVCGGLDTCATCEEDCGPCCDGASCCGNGMCDAGETCSSCAQDCTDGDGQPCPRVGVFYLGWHQPAFNAVQATLDMQAPVLTVEDVIRSRMESGPIVDPVHSYGEILIDNGLYGVAAGFHYQASPAAGPYCIVHARSAGDLNYEPSHEGTYGSGPVADCPGYADTLARHASQLSGLGADFVVVDQTNLSEYDAFSDAIQLRPFEVLIQEWNKLRAAGIKTPDVAAWQRLSAPGTMLPHVLAIYNAPDLEPMIARDPVTHKKLFFYPDIGDVDAGLLAQVTSNGGREDIVAVPMWVHRQGAGSWSFFAECQQGNLLDDGPCAQTPTTNSPVGSQLAVSPSYQSGYASLPFQAVGVYGGLTLRKQFETAFTTKPRWLFLSSFNEHVAQPQTGSGGSSMGLENDASASDQAFVDTYGVEFSRDIEPTEEYGSLVLDLARSCVRVYRTGASTCDDPSEACCQGGDFSDRYAVFDGPDGRFVLYAPALGPGPDRVAIYRCRAGASDDFFSPDPTCEGTAVLGMPGYLSAKKGGETLRALRRCYSPSVGHRYALGVDCPPPTSIEAVLGYVR